MKIQAAFLSAMIVSGTAAAAGPNWAGPYAGIQAGYGWGNVEHNIPAYGSVSDGDADGLVLGGFAGYNMNLQNWVLGFEAGANWNGAEGDNTTLPGEQLSTEQDWDASVVVKLGYPMNNYLIYGLAGAVWTKIESQYTLGTPADDTVSGWTAGAGIESKLTGSTNWRLEYRYADFDEADVTCSICGPTAVDLTSHTITVGLLMHW